MFVLSTNKDKDGSMFSRRFSDLKDQIDLLSSPGVDEQRKKIQNENKKISC